MDRSCPQLTPRLRAREIFVQCALLVGLAACHLAASGSPAAWYLWQSKLDGKLACVQTSPGEGWAKLAGPFADASCGRAH